MLPIILMCGGGLTVFGFQARGGGGGGEWVEAAGGGGVAAAPQFWKL